MNRAENILAFRRANMHGTLSGPNADPDYAERYHPGNETKSPVETFIDRFYEMTQTNPIMPTARVSADAQAMMEIQPYGDGIYISSIQSLYPGERKGGAERMLRQVADLADELGVTLYGTAKAYGTHEGFLTQEQLTEWYRSLGLEIGRGGQVIYRPGSRG